MTRHLRASGADHVQFHTGQVGRVARRRDGEPPDPANPPPIDPSGNRAGRVPRPRKRSGCTCGPGAVAPVNSRGRTTVPDTSALFAPSAPVESVLTAVTGRQSASAGMRAMMQRESEFASPLQAQLTGIALDPPGREFADQVLDAYWSDQPRQQTTLASSSTDREVVIGGGFHAAVYAAVRVLSGYPKPLVLERNERVGGTFAMTARPTFYLNSRNRAGSGGLAGDQGAALNYLPGAPIQAANVSMLEFQANTDMAFVIRLALAQFADVVTDARVVSVVRDGTGVQIEIADRDPLFAGRVIDARGLGDPTGQDVANGTTILTFPLFMQRMASMWPLRGVRRAAVVGGGDSAKCAVESFLGIAPQPFMAAAALDSVDRIGLYPLNCC